MFSPDSYQFIVRSFYISVFLICFNIHKLLICIEILHCVQRIFVFHSFFIVYEYDTLNSFMHVHSVVQNKSSLYPYHVCLFGVVRWEILRNFYSFGHFTITGEGLQRPMLGTHAHWAHLLGHEPTFYNSRKRGPVTLTCTCCRVFWQWYGTPCNIYKDERILKSNYNHGFKNFKTYYICPQNAFLKFDKRDKN